MKLELGDVDHVAGIVLALLPTLDKARAKGDSLPRAEMVTIDKVAADHAAVVRMIASEADAGCRVAGIDPNDPTDTARMKDRSTAVAFKFHAGELAASLTSWGLDDDRVALVENMRNAGARFLAEAWAAK
jgi:hypothetical protein